MRLVVPEFVLEKGSEIVRFPGRSLESSNPVLISIENWELGRAVALSAFAFPSNAIQETGYRTNYIDSFNFEKEYNPIYLSSNPREAISGYWETVYNEITLDRKDFSSADSHLDKIIDMLEVRPLLQKNPFCISGGEMARMMIAAHLAVKPSCLVLDRVLGHLDISARRQLTKDMASFVSDCFLVVLEDDFSEFAGEIWRLESNRMVFSEYQRENIWDIVAEETLQSRSLSFDLVACRPEKKAEHSLIIKNLSGIRDDNEIFKIDHLEAGSGTLIWVLGKNGTGKTSFFETCIGWLAPGSGSIEFKKKEQPIEPDGVVAYSPQDPSYDVTETTVCAEVGLARSSHGNIGQGKTTEEWLLSLGVDEGSIYERIADDMALQKLGSVLAALSRGRPFCLLDEPTASLPIKLRNAIVIAINDYMRSGGTILCSTHDAWFYKKLSDLLRESGAA